MSLLTYGTYRVTLDVTVHGLRNLGIAARTAAEDGGMTAAEWRRLRRSNSDPIGAALQMILDPGQSPPGTEIEESSVERLRDVPTHYADYEAMIARDGR